MERLIFGILRYINALRMSHCVGNHPFKRNSEITLQDIPGITAFQSTK